MSRRKRPEVRLLNDKATLFELPTRRMSFRELARRIQPAEGLIPRDWAPHCNGGGWVQKTAHVAATAFVGPFAIVSGDARVLDVARILDEASVTDMAFIAGEAVVDGMASVGGHAKVFGNARISGEAQVGGLFELSCGEVSEGIIRPLSLGPKRISRGPNQLSLAV